MIMKNIYAVYFSPTGGTQKMGQSFFLWGDDPIHSHFIFKVA